MRRRRVALALTLLVIVCSAGWLLIARQGGPAGLGQGLKNLVASTAEAIEQWTGRQLLEIANTHLKPELTFDRLEYQPPATVMLSNVRLTAESVPIVEAASMRIEFREIPSVGQPIVIQSVELVEPRVRLIGREQGGFLGFSDLIEKPETVASGAAPPPKLSEVFAIRRIGFVNASIEYESPGQPPMVLDQLTFDLTSAPSTNSTLDTGWYAINAKISRLQLFDWSLVSRLNIDTAIMDIERSTCSMKLLAENYSLLPPALQSFARTYEITGEFSADLMGRWDLRNSGLSDLLVHWRLTQGHMAFGKYVLPVDSLECTAHLSGGLLEVKPMVFHGLGGTLALSGNVGMKDLFPANLSVEGAGMRIEQALRPGSDQAATYSGRVEIKGDFTASLASMRDSIAGSGMLKITEGNLVHIPLIAGINTLIGGNAVEDANADSGSTEWQLFGDHIAFRNIDLISNAVAAKGDGEIMFNSTINFRFNAGPVERVQSGLGKVGELLGTVTGQLVKYEASGTLEEPVVAVKPLGLDLGLGQ